MLLDGRLRADPCADGANESMKRPFSFYFLVERSEDKHETNMVVEYTGLSGKLNLDMCGKVDPIVLAKGNLPQCPIMTNPEKIAANTKLVVKEDTLLKKVPPQIQNLTNCFRFAHPAEANQSSETRAQRPETIRKVSEKVIGMLSESQWNVNGKARVSHRKVIGQSSASHRKVIRKSSESHRNVIRLSSERHRRNARRFLAVS